MRNGVEGLAIGTSLNLWIICSPFEYLLSFLTCVSAVFVCLTSGFNPAQALGGYRWLPRTVGLLLYGSLCNIACTWRLKYIFMHCISPCNFFPITVLHARKENLWTCLLQLNTYWPTALLMSHLRKIRNDSTRSTDSRNSGIPTIYIRPIYINNFYFSRQPIYKIIIHSRRKQFYSVNVWDKT